MLDIVLNILTVIGIVLLVLLMVFLIVLLLVLFFPITYRAFGRKKPEEMTAWVKADWLLGLLRIRFFYPQPGNLTVKLLWFTLFDTAQNAKNKSAQTKNEKNIPTNTDNVNPDIAGTEVEENNGTDAVKTANAEVDTQGIPSKNVNANATEDNTTDTGDLDESEATADENISQKKNLKQWVLTKYEKIKYTFQKIYDKIKHIWENITFYKTLLQDEQTVALLKHVWFRLGRISKNIRPRKIRGDILFGTGSPDTTGYVYGLYGMLLPWLGKNINVIPDFTQAILEGELYIAGHITVFQILRHGIMILFDKKLRLLIHRIKTHKI